MTTKCFCDSCGKENAGRVKIDVLSSSPLDRSYTPSLDTDLCQKCFDDLKGRVKNFFSSFNKLKEN